MPKFWSVHSNSIKNFTFLILLVGYPKDPFFGMPLALGLLVFIKDILATFQSRIYFVQFITIILFGFYCGTRWIFQFDSILPDLGFILTLLYKALTGVLIANASFELLKDNYRLIYLYLAIQLLLITTSAYYDNIYAILLMFQTEAAQSVFVHTFGVRSMGFGVLHNEGVAFLALLYSFVLLKNKSGILGLCFAPFMYASALASRMSLILIVMSQALLSPIKLMLSIVAISSALFFLLNTSSGPLSEVFEIYNNFIESGELHTRSTDAMSAMQAVPDNFLSWIVGDGRIITDDGFYKETDLGFSRIIIFGGIVGLIFYLLISFWPLFLIDYRNKKFIFYIFLFNLICYYLIINIKGINIQNWAFITFLLMSRTNFFNKTEPIVTCKLRQKVDDKKFPSDSREVKEHDNMSKSESKIVDTFEQRGDKLMGWSNLLKLVRNNIRTLVGGLLAGGIAGLLVAFSLPAEWEANSLVLIGQLGRVASLDVTENIGSTVSTIEPPLLVIDRIKSKFFQNAVLRNLGIDTSEDSQKAKVFRGSLKVKLEKSELINLTLRGLSPEEAKQHMEALISQLKLVQSRMFLPAVGRWNQELQSVEADLKLANSELERLTVLLNRNSESLNDKNFSQTVLLNNDLILRKKELQILRDRKRGLEERLSSDHTFETNALGAIDISEAPVFPKKLSFVVFGLAFGLLLAFLIVWLRSRPLERGVDDAVS